MTPAQSGQAESNVQQLRYRLNFPGVSGFYHSFTSVPQLDIREHLLQGFRNGAEN
jgi:hypothetical protein